ncbi:agmatine deiminase family protein [Marivibrio halodurans]|uniref:Agmatine deiminase family protein n=1 Tax=Marivibrio halodurans TaxID=2039722 RepID=A0A8J7V2Y2_9PROT|nr:agmatine deiminase family protein [Marivibrio halodurans]MBP5857820.1 agmatine deiminase family protein [Marivibrio halodurans]
MDTRFPSDDGFAMPPEWAPHSATYMAWPCNAAVFRDRLEQARDVYTAVARAIADFEPLVMLADPVDAADASARCGPSVTVVPQPLDDSWARDIGATFVTDGAGRLGGIDWRFNAWGEGYPHWEKDAEVAAAMIERERASRFPMPVFMEGGGLHTDGAGTVLTTDSVILNPNRNPGLTRTEADEILTRALGAAQVIWLDGEALDYDDTDGHIDNLSCFARDGVIATLVSADPQDSQYARLKENADRLRAARDANGKPFEVVEIAHPEKRVEHGNRLALSYINFYIANGAVIMPVFDDPADAAAVETITALFPDRKVITLPGVEVVRGGGCFHCITQQVPRL